MKWKEFLRPTLGKIIVFLLISIILFFPMAYFVLLIRYFFSYNVSDVMYSIISPFQVEIIALILTGIVSYLMSSLVFVYYKRKK